MCRGPAARLERCAAPVLREHVQRLDAQLDALAGARSRLLQVLATADR